MIAADPRIEELALRARDSDSLGRLDVEATAKQHDVEVRAADLGTHAEALTVDGRIILHDHLSSAGRRRFVFAHELGHVLIQRGAMPWVTSRREEQWADWFAHECVFPRRWVRERSWQQLRLFTDPAERRTIAMHLASYLRQSRVLRVDDVVICGQCGDRNFATGCECERYRNSPGDLASLPWLRAASEVKLDQLSLFALDDDPFVVLWRAFVSPPSAYGSAATSSPLAD